MRFEDLEVWKRSARLSAELYKALADLGDFGFRDQITRSGLSVPSNIAEGDERGSDKDSVKFFYIAKGSLAEVQTQLEIALELHYITQHTHNELEKTCSEIGKMLGSLIKARSK